MYLGEELMNRPQSLIERMHTPKYCVFTDVLDSIEELRVMYAKAVSINYHLLLTDYELGLVEKRIEKHDMPVIRKDFRRAAKGLIKISDAYSAELYIKIPTLITREAESFCMDNAETALRGILERKFPTGKYSVPFVLSGLINEILLENNHHISKDKFSMYI